MELIMHNYLNSNKYLYIYIHMVYISIYSNSNQILLMTNIRFNHIY